VPELDDGLLCTPASIEDLMRPYYAWGRKRKAKGGSMQSFPLMEQSVGIGATIANLLAGQPIQYWGRAGVLTVYGNADAVGLNFSLAINDGQETRMVIPAGSGLGTASTVGKVKTNEDFLGQFAIPAGVQLILSVTNPTAGAVKVSFLFVIT
jgi:hypothetical protein